MTGVARGTILFFTFFSIIFCGRAGLRASDCAYRTFTRVFLFRDLFLFKSYGLEV